MNALFDKEAGAPTEWQKNAARRATYYFLKEQLPTP